MFASVYVDGASVGVFVGRVTAVDDDLDTITVSLTAKSGNAPSNGTGTRTIKVGGAWKGPNAAENFPFNFVQATMTNAAGDYPRINLLNVDGTYSVTASIAHANAGLIVWQGGTNAADDLGKATIDGGSAGASYNLLNLTVNLNRFVDVIFNQNGATGSAVGVFANMAAGNIVTFMRCVASNMKGVGFQNNQVVRYIECESFGNGGSGFNFNGASHEAVRCIAHNNTATNGFQSNGSDGSCIDCVADTNTGPGFSITAAAEFTLVRCSSYNNTTAGLLVNAASSVVYAESCIFELNGTYGVNNNTSTSDVVIAKCAFRSNTSGETNGAIDATGSITATASTMVDPANGNFTPATAEVKNAGRGAFTQAAGSYSSSSTSYSDVGAVQHLESPSVGFHCDVLVSPTQVVSY
jgi:hypothetical protein